MSKNKLYGAILGDLAGQPYEYKYEGDFKEFNLHNPDSHITDDTIMTLASADAVLHEIPFEEVYKKWYNLYPDDKYGYGDNFKKWCEGHPEAYTTSYGNGCLMRLAPVIYTRGDVSSSVKSTHNHVDSMQAALLLSIFYQRRNFILTKSIIEPKFYINALDTIKAISFIYTSEDDVTTQNLIEKAVKFGGDTDTNASILGELSNHIIGGLTKNNIEYVRSKLDSYQLSILDKFNKKY